MDDVEIEDVNDDSPYLVEKEPLQNQDLGSFSEIAGEVLSLYGWHLLVVAIVVFLFIQQLRKKRPAESTTTAAPATTEDASYVVRRQEAMEAARRRMQEELDAQAVIFREKQKQKEEEKRRQKLENYKGIVPSLSTDEATSASEQKPKTDKKPMRSTDYSPLSGQGGGTCSWRPGRRGPSSGG